MDDVVNIQGPLNIGVLVAFENVTLLDQPFHIRGVLVKTFDIAELIEFTIMSGLNRS